MLKDNKQCYIYNGKKYNLKQLGKLVSFQKPGDILFSICVKTGKQNIPVKLVFVRKSNKSSEYIVLLSTDCTLGNEEIVRIYGNRWSIMQISAYGIKKYVKTLILRQEFILKLKWLCN